MSIEKDFSGMLPDSAKRIISSALEDIQPGIGTHPNTALTVRESVERAIYDALSDLFEDCGDSECLECSQLATILHEVADAQRFPVTSILDGIAQSIECVAKNRS